MMKLKLKVFLTVWINLLAIFLGIFSALIVYAITYSEGSIFQGFINILFGTLIGIFGIGLVFWVIFVLFTFFLDFLLPFNKESKLNRNLIIEWLVVSIPFFFWIIGGEVYILLAGIIPYPISQFTLRKYKIEKVYQLKNEEDLE